MRIRWAQYVACMGKRRGAYGVLAVKPKRKRPLGRLMHTCEDNVKMDLRELEWGVWFGFIWFRIGTSDGIL
jgi:hypothetical protein